MKAKTKCQDCYVKDVRLAEWSKWADSMFHARDMLVLETLALKNKISLLENDLLRKELGLDAPEQP